MSTWKSHTCPILRHTQDSLSLPASVGLQKILPRPHPLPHVEFCARGGKSSRPPKGSLKNLTSPLPLNKSPLFLWIAVPSIRSCSSFLFLYHFLPRKNTKRNNRFLPPIFQLRMRFNDPTLLGRHILVLESLIPRGQRYPKVQKERQRKQHIIKTQ